MDYRENIINYLKEKNIYFENLIYLGEVRTYNEMWEQHRFQYENKNGGHVLIDYYHCKTENSQDWIG